MLGQWLTAGTNETDLLNHNPSQAVCYYDNGTFRELFDLQYFIYVPEAQGHNLFNFP